MTTGNLEVGAEISIQEFNMSFVVLTGSVLSTKGTIAIRSFGPTSIATLENLVYEQDGEFLPITLIDPPTDMVVAVGPAGALTELVWDLKADFGSDYFNKSINVYANLDDGAHMSPTAYGVLRVNKTLVTNELIRDPIRNATAVGSSVSFNSLKKRD